MCSNTRRQRIARPWHGDVGSRAIRINDPYTSVDAKRSIRADGKRTDIKSVSFPGGRRVHVISAAGDKAYRRCCIGSFASAQRLSSTVDNSSTVDSLCLSFDIGTRFR